MAIRTAAVILAIFLMLATVRAAEPVFFRHDYGVSDAKSAPLQFDDESTVWKVSVPRGHSTPVLWQDRIFLTSFDSETQRHSTHALDRMTGQEVWRRAVPTHRVEQQHAIGSPASATVTTDGDRVYSFFGSYGLLCHDLNGNQIWSKPMGPFQDEFGSSSSPILVDGRLILSEDHDVNSFVTAIDATTGDTLWKTPREFATRSYATPTIWHHEGKTEVIVSGALELASYDLDTGEKLWWVRGLARIVNTTPVVLEDRIIVATWAPGGDAGERIGMDDWQKAVEEVDANRDGRITKSELQPGAVLTRFFRIDLNQDGALDRAEWERQAAVFARAENQVMAIRPGGSGDITDHAVLWRNPSGAPYVSSPLVHDGVVYVVKDGGILTTIDLESGATLRMGRLRGRGNYYSSPVLVGANIYTASQQGVLTVVSAAAKWGVLTSHDFGDGIYATPVCDSSERMYLRTEGSLMCFQAPDSK